jgi:hypothetical protein
MSALGRVSLSAAIPTYLGDGHSPFPKPDAARLVPEHGVEQAQLLSAAIEDLLSELDATVPNWGQHTLASGSAWAVVARLRERHTAIDERAAAVLVWAYSYWNR